MAESAPPESLLNYEAPLFVGENSKDSTKPVPESQGSASQVDEIINSMLPPREWTEESGNWMQYTAKSPATRLDVISLQENLDARLLDRQARETGICPVREDLYQQAFDELIRQVAINGPERGLLLLRVRDEIRMTMDAYKTLYESSVTFGVRKQLQAGEGMGEMENKIEELEASKRSLENQVLELRNKVDVIEKREAERRALAEKKRKDEIDFVKYQGQHLDTFLKSLGGGKA